MLVFFMVGLLDDWLLDQFIVSTFLLLYYLRLALFYHYPPNLWIHKSPTLIDVLRFDRVSLLITVIYIL